MQFAGEEMVGGTGKLTQLILNNSCLGNSAIHYTACSIMDEKRRATTRVHCTKNIINFHKCVPEDASQKAITHRNL